ncbi:MAG: thioredoxin [Lachnospiraceae bacterium]|jgi:thioredoxin 1
MEYKFTSDNFQKEVLNSDKPVLVDFYADWCGPCKMMGPVVGQIAEKFDGEAKVGKVNSDEEQNLAIQYGVSSIPNFVFIKNGQVVDRVVGAVPSGVLEQKLKSLI